MLLHMVISPWLTDNQRSQLGVYVIDRILRRRWSDSSYVTMRSLSQDQQIYKWIFPIIAIFQITNDATRSRGRCSAASGEILVRLMSKSFIGYLSP